MKHMVKWIRIACICILILGLLGCSGRCAKNTDVPSEIVPASAAPENSGNGTNEIQEDEIISQNTGDNPNALPTMPVGTETEAPVVTNPPAETEAPAATDTPEPADPTDDPSEIEIPIPTAAPTATPTATPKPGETAAPTAAPTPTPAPTEEQSPSPTEDNEPIELPELP